MGGADDAELESLRTPWESDDQWSLRSAFLNRHWHAGEFGHDRLVCLSQMFINIEFLGCKYDERLMPVVARMSAGLTDEYRERRRHVVHETFVREGQSLPAADPRELRVGHERKRRSGPAGAGDNIGTRDPNAAEAKRLKKELLAASNESSVEMGRCKSIMKIKAELSVSPSGLGAIEQLNAACNRAKLPWRMVDEADGGGGGLVRRHVVIDSTLVASVACADTSCARTAAAATALRRIRAPYYDVRQAEPVGEYHSSVLHVRDDARQDYRSPGDDVHVHSGDKLVRFARQQLASPAADFVSFVGAAELADISAEVTVKQITGWQVEHQLLLDKITVTSATGKAAMGESETSTRRMQLVAAGMAALRRPHVRVVEDADGRPTLLADDKPIGDEAVAKFLAGAAK